MEHSAGVESSVRVTQAAPRRPPIGGWRYRRTAQMAIDAIVRTATRYVFQSSDAAIFESSFGIGVRG
ncbi:MAG TPA: hypothetical protein VGI39_16245 [Polyangiaceae bacterium]